MITAEAVHIVQGTAYWFIWIPGRIIWGVLWLLAWTFGTVVAAGNLGRDTTEAGAERVGDGLDRLEFGRRYSWHALFCLAFFLGGGVVMLRHCPESKPEPIAKKKDTPSRPDIQPFDESILPDATSAYNRYVSSAQWRKRAAACVNAIGPFDRIGALAKLPPDLLAGIALHESAGCDMSASDRAGGKGMMQITNVSDRHIARAASLLGIAKDRLDYERDPLHNVAVGAAVLSDYERRLESRPHGLLAYNRGVAGVRSDARDAGWSGDDLPSIVEMKPFLVQTERIKPRIYVEKVLACAAMIKKAREGKPLVPVALLRPADIPGWDPQDGS